MSTECKIIKLSFDCIHATGLQIPSMLAQLLVCGAGRLNLMVGNALREEGREEEQKENFDENIEEEASHTHSILHTYIST